jgi:HAD superfamily hydrolase (TIGR01509 family)
MPLMVPQAILFDMDGTLTRPMLDFAAIKAEMEIGDRAILEAMAAMSPAERQRCETILDRHEEEAAEQSELNEGCRQTLDYLRHRGLRTALITRNSGRSVETVLARHGLQFDCVIARETCAPKPHPAPLVLACETLSVTMRHAWMVGDGRYDIEAGRAAGAWTIWISHGQRRPFAAEPNMEVKDLGELQSLFRRTVEGVS